MIGINKVLVVVVYTLLLSVISYKHNITHYENYSLTALIEKEGTAMPRPQSTLYTTNGDMDFCGIEDAFARITNITKQQKAKANVKDVTDESENEIRF